MSNERQLLSEDSNNTNQFIKIYQQRQGLWGHFGTERRTSRVLLRRKKSKVELFYDWWERITMRGSLMGSVFTTVVPPSTANSSRTPTNLTDRWTTKSRAEMFLAIADHLIRPFSVVSPAHLPLFLRGWEIRSCYEVTALCFLIWYLVFITVGSLNGRRLFGLFSVVRDRTVGSSRCRRGPR